MKASPRDRSYKKSLGHRHEEIKKSKVLLVGAGGIGCELLKNLVKAGFGEIHLIDLDTIDLSNLNRQFLFRNEHIKKSKAIVAKDVAQKFNPRVSIVAHHANIKDKRFDVAWFQTFQIVFNALDNIDARRHVNRMCLFADVPLIESGTTGYNGNVQVIKKGKTACYDCAEKAIPKSFPVCTIRSTPSQPIHCIVWAKSYLLPELFGTSEDEVAELDTTEDSENAEEIKKLKAENEALKEIRKTMGTADFPKLVFEKVYKQDIERLAGMTEMWKDKKPPIPLNYEILQNPDQTISRPTSDQRVWSIPHTFSVFVDSLQRLANRLSREKARALQGGLEEPSIAFDKDDEDTLDFVTAAANLRSAVFSIEPKSKFETKQMAGNIIPAIATTNAMTAALCVFEAFKIVYSDLAAKNDGRGDKFTRTPQIWLQSANMRASTKGIGPNPDCAVCSTAMARLQVDLSRATLGDLLVFLAGDLDYSTQINVLNESGNLLYDYIDADEDQEAAETLHRSKLTDLNVTVGSVLIVKDDADEDQRVDLQLYIENTPSNETATETRPVRIHQTTTDKLEIPLKPPKRESETNGVNGSGHARDELSTSIGKRKRSLDDDDVVLVDEPPAKKTQTNGLSNGAMDGTTVDASGSIVIDD